MKTQPIDAMPKTEDENSGKCLLDTPIISAQKELPRVPLHALPSNLVIAIDGTAQSGKNTIGEIVAQSIGAMLVDTDRIFRALIRACLEASLPLHKPEAIKGYLNGVALMIRRGWDGGKVKEAIPFIEGKFYSKEELKAVSLSAWRAEKSPEVRAGIITALRACAVYGRVVMVGHNIGDEIFPKTPYKFFLDATLEAREARHQREFGKAGAAQRDSNDNPLTRLAEDALMIDSTNLSADEIAGIILTEVFWRADESRLKRVAN
jgi:cytidylate kinase